jgi:hypothetical protein
MATIEKNIKEGIIVGDERFLRFRSDGFYDCKSRFKNVPEKIELNAKNLTKVIKGALKGDAELSDKEFEKELKKQTKENNEKGIKNSTGDIIWKIYDNGSVWSAG